MKKEPQKVAALKIKRLNLPLAEHEKNPRIHPEPGSEEWELLKTSLTDAYFDPLVYNLRNKKLVSGHLRQKVMLTQGFTQCDCVVVDWPEDQHLARMIAANRGMGQDDEAGLRLILGDLSESGIDLKLTGLSDSELGSFGIVEENDSEDEKAVELIDHAAELQKKWGTAAGDVWVLGNHKIVCDDCLNAGRYGIANVDLCITSPPYNVNIPDGGHWDKMGEEDYLKLIDGCLKVAYGLMSKGRFVAWNVGVSPKTLHLKHGEILAGMFEFQRQIVWRKVGVAYPLWQNTKSARGYMPNYSHEIIYLFSKGEPEIGEAIKKDDLYSSDVWTLHQSDIPGDTNGRYAKNKNHGGSKKSSHPAPFPIAVPLGIIKHLTSESEVVFDPFIGSGTTMMACEAVDRKCFGTEKDPKYVAICLERWNAKTGEIPVRANGH